MGALISPERMQHLQATIDIAAADTVHEAHGV